MYSQISNVYAYGNFFFLQEWNKVSLMCDYAYFPMTWTLNYGSQLFPSLNLMHLQSMSFVYTNNSCRLLLIKKKKILVGFYRGITPGITGSLATGATYFGVIESTKKWIEESHPDLSGHMAHFIAGAAGKLFAAPRIFIPL